MQVFYKSISPSHGAGSDSLRNTPEKDPWEYTDEDARQLAAHLRQKLLVGEGKEKQLRILAEKEKSLSISCPLTLSKIKPAALVSCSTLARASLCAD